MKIKNKSKISKTQIIIGVVLLLLLATTAGYLFYRSLQKKPDVAPINTVSYDKATPAQQEAGHQIKKDFESRETEASQQQKASTAPSTTPTPVVVPIQLTTATVVNGTLRIRTIIPTIDDKGKCIVTLTKNGITVTREADTQTMGSYTTCKGFDIPATAFEKGKWSMSIQYTGSNQRSGEIKSEVSI